MSMEQRLLLSKIKMGKPNFKLRGHKKSPETLAKISRALKGRKVWNKGIPISDEQKQKLSISLKGKGIGNQYAKGKHPTAEQKAKTSERSKKMWANEKKRAKIIAKRCGQNSYLWNPNREEVKAKLGLALFYRFTKRQRAMWLKNYCEFCGETQNLELDHKIAVINGGTNIEENAQTLCKRCNIWKRNHIDYAIARKRGELLETPVKQDNQQPSAVNGLKVTAKVQRLMGEEPTNNPNTSAPHSNQLSDDIVRATE